MKNNTLKKTWLSRQVKNNMTSFGMYANMDRAIAEISDGLKPSQRRVLYAMIHDLGARPTSNKVKAARIDGIATGLYHPHGTCYGTLVNMALPHKMRYPLIDPQGNFGTWTDNAAAARYVEARVKPIAMELFRYMDVAPMTKNYDGTTEEPLYLPSRLPFLLLNGSKGIGVGMSSSIPSHNLTEVMNACIRLLKKPNASLKSICKRILGPDFNHGRLISSPEEIQQIYKDGYGSLRYQCLFHFETDKKLKEERLVISNYAPGFSVNSFIKKCAGLAEKGIIQYVANETDKKHGIRLVVAFNNSTLLKTHVLPYLEATDSYQFYTTIRQGTEPILKPTNLLGYLKDWLAYRLDIEKKIQKSDQKKLEAQLAREQTRLKAILNPKQWIKIITKAKTEDDAKQKLMKVFKLTEELADFMLSLTMRSLLRANKAKQEQLIKNLKEASAKIQIILKDLTKEVIRQFKEDIKKYGDARKTLFEKQEIALTNSSKSIYILATRKGKISKMETLPLKGRKFAWDFVIKTTNQFTVIDQTGQAHSLDAWSLSSAKIKNIAGIVSSNAPRYAVLTHDGHLAILETAQKKNVYQTLKTEANVIEVVDLYPKDRLIVWQPEQVKELEPNEIKKKTKRPNCNGKVFIGKHKKLRLYVEPTPGGLFDEDFNEVSEEDILDSSELFSLNKKDNFIIYSDGSKDHCKIANIDDEKSLLKTFPL